MMSLLKRWLLGTHQGAVSHKHLRTRSPSVSELQKPRQVIVQQAVAVDPATYKMIVKSPNHKILGLPESTGYPSKTF